MSADERLAELVAELRELRAAAEIASRSNQAMPHAALMLTAAILDNLVKKYGATE